MKKKNIRAKPAGRYHHGDLKAALLQAALTHMKATGSIEFSLRDITKRAGVTHTSIYRHFPSKVYVLAAIAEEGFLRFKQKLEQSSGSKIRLDPAQQMIAQGIAYVGFALDHPMHYRIMFSENIRQCMELPSLAKATQDAFMSLMNLVVRGIESGAFKNRDPRELALAIWSGTHGLSMLMLNGLLEDAFEITANKHARAATMISEFLQNGILTKKNKT